MMQTLITFSPLHNIYAQNKTGACFDFAMIFAVYHTVQWIHALIHASRILSDDKLHAKYVKAKLPVGAELFYHLAMATIGYIAMAVIRAMTI